METIASFLKSRFFLALLLLAVLIALFLRYCKTEKPVPYNGPIKAPHAVALIETSAGAAQNVQDAEVTIIDPGGMVVSSNGFAFGKIKVTGGVMSIGLSPKAKFGPENPYAFAIRVEAAGYMTNIRNVVIAQDAPGYVPIYLAKLDNLPPGALSATVANIAGIQSGILPTRQILTAAGLVGSKSDFTITIPEGTILLNDGKRVDGKDGQLSYRLLAGSPLDPLAGRVFPGGFEVTNAVGADGKPIVLANQKPNSPANPAFFTTAGWFSLVMNLGAERVNGFSNPVTVEMPVPEGILDGAGKPVKLGSAIPLWSMDDRTGIWKNEGSATVKPSDNGGMKVAFETKHFSTWNLDFMAGGCPGTLQLAYNTATFTGQKFTRLADRATGTAIKSSLIDFSAGGSPLNLLRLPNNVGQTCQLFVHGGADESFPVTGTSDDIINCVCSAPCSLKVLPAGAACVTLRFQIGGNGVLLCNNSVWYKLQTTPPAPPTPLYTLAGVLPSGMVSPGELNMTAPTVAQEVRLWYVESGVEQRLDFSINFGALPSPATLNRPLLKNGAVIGEISYVVSAAGCGKLIIITLPIGVPGGCS